MGRKRFDEMNCGVAQALEAIGDWWSLLIVRDAFFGARRFGEFERSLGIAKNILSDRLRRLVEHGIFDRIDVGDAGERFEYRLTKKGEALLTVLTAMREWSDEWVFGRGKEPLIVRERKTGRRSPSPARCRPRRRGIDAQRSAHGTGPRRICQLNQTRIDQ